MDADVAKQIVLGLEKIGETVSQEQAALMMAQVALETANGQQCYGHNPGNMTANEWQYTGNFYRPQWWSVDATSSPRMVALNKLMHEGKAPRAFRSYMTLQAGFDDHFAQIAHTFKALLVASRTGDPQKFADAIKSSRYTPDEPASAAHSLEQLQDKYLSAGLFETHPLADDASLASDVDDEPVPSW